MSGRHFVVRAAISRWRSLQSGALHTSTAPVGFASELEGGQGSSVILLYTGSDSYFLLDGDGPLFAY